MVYRTRKLATEAMKELKNLTSWVSQHEHANVRNAGKDKDKFRKKAMDCRKLLAEYDEFTTDSERLDYLMYSQLGLFAFSRSAYTASYRNGYTPELEIDVAGSSFIALGSYKKECGEIKSGDRLKAIDQLMVRLGIFWASSEEMEESLTRCALQLPLDLVTLAVRQP